MKTLLKDQLRSDRTFNEDEKNEFVQKIAEYTYVSKCCFCLPCVVKYVLFIILCSCIYSDFSGTTAPPSLPALKPSKNTDVKKEESVKPSIDVVPKTVTNFQKILEEFEFTIAIGDAINSSNIVEMASNYSLLKDNYVPVPEFMKLVCNHAEEFDLESKLQLYEALHKLEFDCKVLIRKIYKLLK